MFMDFDTAVGGKSPIKEVRDTMNDNGCVSMNPFFSAQSSGKLFELLSDFSKNMESAMEKLSAISGHEIPEQSKDEKVILTASFAKAGKDAEKNMTKAFIEGCKDADTALRALEKTPEDTVLAQNAMIAMKGFKRLIDSIPEVYKSIPVEQQSGFAFRI